MTASLRRCASAFVAFSSVAALPCLAQAAPATGEDIRDIRGPIAIPPWWRWPLAIALAALAALVVILLVRWWRTRSSRTLSPIERARRALDLAEGHAREARSHEWAEVVAEVVRSALATHLGVEVLPQTTAELAAAPWARSRLAETVDAARVIALLETCDLARFAKATLESKPLLEENTLARELVEGLLAPPPRAAAKERLEPRTVTS